MTATLELLRVSDDLALPLDSVTETFAFIAKRRVGKSNAAVVLAEQMYYAGIPWVCIDPKGDWWGIRSSVDGKREGLSVTVFGGKHGDRPLVPGAGAVMAALIVERRMTCILDVSEFSQAEKIQFLLAFATRLLQVNEEPVHLFFEECDDYIPQNLIGKNGGDEDETKLVRAFSRLIRHGGFKGIGASLITQRAALVSKNVLAQVDTFIALRTTEPLDIAVVNARLKGHPRQKEIVESLPSLQAGDAWIISPAFLEVYMRTSFYRRTTFDSGRTPKLGEKRVIPTKLAEVELDEITAAMTAIIEQAEATDPDKLGKKLLAQQAITKRLEADIAELQKLRNVQPPQPETIVIEVEVVPDDICTGLAALCDAVGALTTNAATLSAGASELVTDVETGVKTATALLGRVHAVNTEQRRTRAPAPVRPGRAAAKGLPSRQPAVPVRATRMVTPHLKPDVDDDVKLKAGARRMLETLARQYPIEMTRRQLGTLAKVAASGGTFGDYMSVLRGAGYIDEPSGPKGPVVITEAGFAKAGIEPSAPMTSAEIVKMYQQRLKAGARRMLDVLVDEWPNGLTREELAGRAEIALSGGTFGDYLSVLRTNGLSEEPDGSRGLIYAGDALHLTG